VLLRPLSDADVSIFEEAVCDSETAVDGTGQRCFAACGGRAGFEREGLLRSYSEIDGRRRDAVLYSLLPSDLG
jgi:hypothetical protein